MIRLILWALELISSLLFLVSEPSQLLGEKRVTFHHLGTNLLPEQP